MQNLTAPPRNSLTPAQVISILTGDQLAVSAGLELLDSNNNFVSDISNSLVSGQVDRNNAALVQGTCNLVIEQALAWGKDRVRPYMTLTANGISARFNLGVFVMTSPDTVREENPTSYKVVGYDLLFLLQSSIADTYVVNSGTTYLSAVQGLITASGIGATVNLDGTLGASILPTTMVWALDPTVSTTWLSVINDLLATINYRPLWADENGILHSAPYIPPVNRSVEWTFDTSNKSTNIIGPKRTLITDVWGAKNWFRFVRKAMTVQPIEGAGIYTVTPPSTGPFTIAALGRTVKASTQFLDAADQTSLVAQGDKIVALNHAVSRTFQITVDALPIAGHYDVVQFTDSGSTDKCQVSTWSLPLDGSQGKWTLEAVNG